ncbi:MAG: hypothetical protein K2P90_00100 [Holosporales bacterium]|nr:hypothetical protein [Holosporales bacterium]
MGRLAFILGVLFLEGCSLIPGPPGLQLKNISLLSKEKANKNSALTVDLVVLYDKELLKKLQGMTSVQYFSSIDQLRRDNMSMTDIWRWELVPGQFLVKYQPIYENKKVWGALFFADYHTPGDHRVGIGTSHNLCVTFGEEDIDSVSAEDAPGLFCMNDPEGIIIYPVKETVVLNTRTPSQGMKNDDQEKMKKTGSDKAQNPQENPSAALQE